MPSDNDIYQIGVEEMIKRYLFLFFFLVVISSLLIFPVSAAGLNEDEIIIIKQPVDAFYKYSQDGLYYAYFSVDAVGDNLSYQWQVKIGDSSDWIDFTGFKNSGTTSNLIACNSTRVDDRLYRCKIISANGTVVYTRAAVAELPPTNFFNFVGSCLRYVTSYISLIVNSLITPGAELYPMLSILAVGIAVTVALVVIKIFKSFSWGL